MFESCCLKASQSSATKTKCSDAAVQVAATHTRAPGPPGLGGEPRTCPHFVLAVKIYSINRILPGGIPQHLAYLDDTKGALALRQVIRNTNLQQALLSCRRVVLSSGTASCVCVTGSTSTFGVTLGLESTNVTGGNTATISRYHSLGRAQGTAAARQEDRHQQCCLKHRNRAITWLLVCTARSSTPALLPLP